MIADLNLNSNFWCSATSSGLVFTTHVGLGCDLVDTADVEEHDSHGRNMMIESPLSCSSNGAKVLKYQNASKCDYDPEEIFKMNVLLLLCEIHYIYLHVICQMT